jgi:hypothetical protein
MECPICSSPVPPGARGQARTYCSPEHRKRAELDARRRRKLEKFEAAMLGDVASREDVLILLSAAARTGSVLAAKTLLEELRRDGGDVPVIPSVVDEIASKRIKAAAKGSR